MENLRRNRASSRSTANAFLALRERDDRSIGISGAPSPTIFPPGTAATLPTLSGYGNDAATDPGFMPRRWACAGHYQTGRAC